MQPRAVVTDREPGLQRRCEQVLATAARAAGAGTRQQVRAAARGFVRRHRRDRSYLAFVLRGVLANSALAAVLLGLAPAPAHAVATYFAQQTGAANPLNGQDIGSYSAPATGDLDADGDLDVIAGSFNGTFRYFENTGGATAPAFALRTGTANPLVGEDLGFYSTPALGDLDGDGDLDVVAGETNGAFLYFENTGSAKSPAFVQRTGSTNPLDSQDAGANSAPALADLDRDGDLDLVAGKGFGSFAYYENTGTRSAPAFVPRTGGANPFNSLSAGYDHTPALGDLDGDGDLDLVAGERYGSFIYCENTGSAALPAFVERSGGVNPLFGRDVGAYSTPALGDLDGDGDLDLVAGTGSGLFQFDANLAGDFGFSRTWQAGTAFATNIYIAPALGDLDGDGDRDVVEGKHTTNGGVTLEYLENTGNATVPDFQERTGSANPFNGQYAGQHPMPALGDLDLDGDLDLVVGESGGRFSYFQNTGTANVPAFAALTGSANPVFVFDVGSYSAPALSDLDDDGDLDLVVGEQSGIFFYLENTGSATVPAFIVRTPEFNPLSGRDVGDRSVPALGDVDGDGDLDLLAGENLGAFFYFENTGSTTVPAFAQRTAGQNPMNGHQLTTKAAPALGDVDGDGDADAVSGEGRFGIVYLYLHENAIVRPAPLYTGPTAQPFAGVDVGSFSSPAAGDLDGDGDPDFVASQSFASGQIHYFQNTGSALLPAVVERTGAANPFDGLNASIAPRLALGDVDADGDLDLVSGDGYFNPVQFFENTGTATAPGFVERSGGANPFNGVIEGRSAPAFGDVDGDGDLDLAVGEIYGSFQYYRNTGDAETPTYTNLTGNANPFYGLIGPAGFVTLALGDVDRDGDLDLVAGDEAFGVFSYFENTGTATSPAYVPRTGPANPLDGEDVGLNSSPTFVDLDADGDPDLVSGERYGALIPYYLPEPAAPLAVGAAAGLLAWLARWRKRTGARGSMR